MDFVWIWSSLMSIVTQLKPTSKKETVRWVAFSVIFIILGYSIYYIKSELIKI